MTVNKRATVNKLCHRCKNITNTQLCCGLTIGLIKRSYLGGFRVKPSPTKQTLVTIRFQAFFCLFPVLMTLSTSVSPWARTLGKGTSHFPYRKKTSLDCGTTFGWMNYSTTMTDLQCGVSKRLASFGLLRKKNKREIFLGLKFQAAEDTYRLFLPLLFNHVGKDFSARLSLSVQQVRRHCSLWGLVIILLLGLPLFMHLEAAGGVGIG